MRWFALGAIVLPLILLMAPEARAQNYPWCAEYGFKGGVRNCGFVSYAQCMATVSGIGGYCQQNPMYRPAPPAPRKARKARRHQ
jgi:hypothetical protein